MMNKVVLYNSVWFVVFPTAELPLMAGGMKGRAILVSVV